VIAQALVSQSHPVHVAQLRHDPGKGKVVMRWLWWSFDGFLLVQLDGVFSILHSPGIAVPSSLLEDSYFLAILACNLFSYITTPESVSSISGHASRAPVAKADD